MRFNEPIAELRRIPVYLVDIDGDPVTGATPLTLQVSLSGAAWALGGGSWVEVGAGLYYYEATQAETMTFSYVLLRVTATGARDFVFAVDIGTRIHLTAEGEARRVAVYLVDVGGNGVPGVVPTSLEVSLRGDLLTAASGAFTEIGDGAYSYELAGAELVEGFGVLRVTGAGVLTFVYTWDVVDGSIVDESGPAEPILATPSIGMVIEEIDHVAAALRRLPHMYRGSDG